ncbi:MAG: ABC transporter permease [Spirochaetales bacterium]|nr:ABC transporter permease [Spirochaetales bacterium]
MKIKIKSSKNFTLFIIMMMIFILLSIVMPSKFLTGINLQSMASQFPEFGLLALAMMMAMITGGIDLSIISISNFTGVIAALILSGSMDSSTPAGVAILFAVVAVVAVSMVCGLLNGLLIAMIGVPPILATLGTQGLFLGLAIVITKGHSVSGFPEVFMGLGSGTVIGIPVPFMIFALIAFLVSVLLKRTRQGFNMFMVGANPVVSKFSGVNNTKVLINTYMLTAVLAGLASLIMISRVNSMRPGYGTAYLLQAILVAVLGGTDPDGGFGSVKGLVMGIVILQITQSGLNIMSFSPFFKKFIWGFALLAIMVINFLLHKYNEKKRIQSMTDMKKAAKAG